jgi:hypothetical protein
MIWRLALATCAVAVGILVVGSRTTALDADRSIMTAGDASGRMRRASVPYLVILAKLFISEINCIA